MGADVHFLGADVHSTGAHVHSMGADVHSLGAACAMRGETLDDPIPSPTNLPHKCSTWKHASTAGA